MPCGRIFVCPLCFGHFFLPRGKIFIKNEKTACLWYCDRHYNKCELKNNSRQEVPPCWKQEIIQSCPGSVSECCAATPRSGFSSLPKPTDSPITDITERITSWQSAALRRWRIWDFRLRISSGYLIFMLIRCFAERLICAAKSALRIPLRLRSRMRLLTTKSPYPCRRKPKTNPKIRTKFRMAGASSDLPRIPLWKQANSKNQIRRCTPLCCRRICEKTKNPHDILRTAATMACILTCLREFIVCFTQNLPNNVWLRQHVVV